MPELLLLDDDKPEDPNQALMAYLTSYLRAGNTIDVDTVRYMMVGSVAPNGAPSATNAHREKGAMEMIISMSLLACATLRLTRDSQRQRNKKTAQAVSTPDCQLMEM